MAGNQVLALMLIFGFSFAIAKNWRKVLVVLGALAMTAVCFTVYTIVNTVQSNIAPADVQTIHPNEAQKSTVSQGR